ncbi:type I methionyl aminopeptidase [Candidatus Gottesmanbacteria bacterium RBG_16_37_8]|uniref:Methionine aminopeptidase n=1 Tax=Candidatus Gottesmanbacteria bacterium RBG_16_37_8 TaxID=1798371 RepID=A0A1F5YVR9_9BACT|nr:MAG: type I methionyl aminopeptidase [Candidatus Gottesmanbacteria bacterium RBG_16_37_8]
MPAINLKTDKEIEIMKEGGLILNQVMERLLKTVDVGISMLELDNIAEKEIIKKGAKPSFKMVPGYKWTICACINDVVVHGIPDNYQAKKGDVVGLDSGVYYRGFHTDCSWSVRVGKKSTDKNDEIDRFLAVGRQALDKAINQAHPGNYIFDISRAIQTTVEKEGYSVVRSLIGHGIGKNLHEEPEIPGFVQSIRENTPIIKPGLTIAIEVIYNLGSPDVILNKGNGWTIQTKDGKISGLFETTVAVNAHGVILLTKKYGPSGDN